MDCACRRALGTLTRAREFDAAMMAEQEFTRCPGCKTIFRVTPQQLTLRGGQVRCGHCHTVFNGVAALLSLAPRPRPERTEPVLDEAALGPPTVTLRAAHALEPSPPDAARSRSGAPSRRSTRRLPTSRRRRASTPKPRTQHDSRGRKSASGAGCRRGSTASPCRCSCCCWPGRHCSTSATRSLPTGQQRSPR